MRNLLIWICIIYPSSVLAQNQLPRFIVSAKIVNEAGTKIFPTLFPTSSSDSCQIFVKENYGQGFIEKKVITENIAIPDYLCTIKSNKTPSVIILYVKTKNYKEEFYYIVPEKATSSNYTNLGKTYYIDLGVIQLKKKKKDAIQSSPPYSQINGLPKRRFSNPKLRIELVAMDKTSGGVLKGAKLEYAGMPKDTIIRFDNTGKVYFFVDSIQLDSLEDLLICATSKQGYHQHFQYLVIEKKTWALNTYRDTIWLESIKKISQVIIGQLVFANQQLPVKGAIVQAHHMLMDISRDTTDAEGYFTIVPSKTLFDSLSYKREISITLTVTRPNKAIIRYEITLPTHANIITLLLDDGRFVNGRVYSKINNKPLPNILIRTMIIEPKHWDTKNIYTKTDELGFFELGFDPPIEKIGLIFIDTSGKHREKSISNISVVSEKPESLKLDSVILNKVREFKNLPFFPVYNSEKKQYKSFKYLPTEILGSIGGLAGGIGVKLNYRSQYNACKCNRPPSTFYEEKCKELKSRTIKLGIGIGVVAGVLLAIRYLPPKKQNKRTALSISPSLFLHNGVQIPSITISSNF